MKKLLVVALSGIFFSSCVLDDFSGGGPGNQDPDSRPNPLNEFRANQLGSAENPILVGDDELIESVTYTLPNCDGGEFEAVYRGGNFIARVGDLPTVTPGQDVQLEETDAGCFTIRENPLPSTEIFVSGFHYNIRGEVLRIAAPDGLNIRSWIREEENNTVSLARIPANPDSEITFNTVSRNLADPIPDEIFSCVGVSRFSGNSNFQEGDFYIAQGDLGDYIGQWRDRRLIFINYCSTF